MLDISVNYMGLKLKSPFIAASSGYTANIDKIVALAHCGIGAVVLKSLFEEQIDNEVAFMEEQSAYYPENADFLRHYVREHSLSNYLELIKAAKESVDIPIIASINCYSPGEWTDFAVEIERAGADAIEVNIYSLPVSPFGSSLEIENSYKATVKAITEVVKIPVAVKIAENFTSLTQFVPALEGYGASAAVLFNRFYRPDISLKSLKIVPAKPFSGKCEYLRELRWIALISPLLRQMDLSASTGVHDPVSAIKLLLAGAKTIQLCSVLYQQGPFVITNFTDELRRFMREKGFKRIDDFCGKLNYSNISRPQEFERVQFLKNADRY